MEELSVKKEENRYEYFDLLKVIAMMYVMFSHVLQRVVGGVTNTAYFGFFYSVHMPLFMFVSGYFLKRCERILDLLKYFLKLILYYLIPSILFTVLTVLTMSRYANHDLIYWLKEYVLRTDTFYWYAIAMIIINMIIAIAYYLINLFLKQDKLYKEIIVNVLVSIIFVGGIVPFYLISKGDLPELLSANLIVYLAPFTMIGFLLKSFDKYIKEGKLLLIIELVLMLVCLALYVLALYKLKGFVGILNNPTTKLLILHQLGSLAGVIVYYVLAKGLCKINLFKKISKYGKYSFELYLVHVYIIRIITPYVSRIEEVNFYSISFIISYELIFALGSLLLTMILADNKYINKVLFCKFKL